MPVRVVVAPQRIGVGMHSTSCDSRSERRVRPSEPLQHLLAPTTSRYVVGRNGGLVGPTEFPCRSSSRALQTTGPLI